MAPGPIFLHAEEHAEFVAVNIYRWKGNATCT
jgi:hypothetical protein